MDCPHFSDLVFTQAKKYGDKNVLWFKDMSEKWNPISWNLFAQKTNSLAKALYDLGVRDGDRLAIYSNNKVECFVTDFALYALQAITVPLFATASVEQVNFVLNDAQIKCIFVGNQEQYENAFELLGKSEFLKQIIIFDDTVITHGEKNSHFYRQLLGLGVKSASDAEVEAARARATVSQTASILYTSGTTGESKGVMITHENYLETIRLHTLKLSMLRENERSLAFLPINHVFERAWSYFCLFMGYEIYVNENPRLIQTTLQEVRPTTMCTVPRFWEKIYSTALGTIESYGLIKRIFVLNAIRQGRRYNIDFLRLKRKPSIILKLKYRLADRLVFSTLKKRIGLEDAILLPTAGASLADEITVFFRSLGVPLVYGYGLTETTATISCFDETAYVIGTVGSVLPDLQIKIGDHDEILVKGKTIFSGYYNRPQLNSEVFTSDGYFKTGDAGKLTQNNIILTERLKDLFKTSNGKYIAPQQIEMRLTADIYFEQAAIIADKRNFVSAIIHPDIDKLKQFAKENNIQCKTINDLFQNQEVRLFIESRIDLCQKGMAAFEKIKRFTLIKNGFSIETGELTDTLKVRRSVIEVKYKKEIDQMYEDQ